MDFCLKIINLYGFITVVYCDSAEQTLIAGMRTAVRKGGAWMDPDRERIKDNHQ